jgi:hypothetical protein
MEATRQGAQRVQDCRIRRQESLVAEVRVLMRDNRCQLVAQLVASLSGRSTAFLRGRNKSLAYVLRTCASGGEFAVDGAKGSERVTYTPDSEKEDGDCAFVDSFTESMGRRHAKRSATGPVQAGPCKRFKCSQELQELRERNRQLEDHNLKLQGDLDSHRREQEQASRASAPSSFVDVQLEELSRMLGEYRVETTDMHARIIILAGLFRKILDHADVPEEFVQDLKAWLEVALPPRDGLETGDGSDRDTSCDHGHAFAARAQDLWNTLDRFAAGRARTRSPAGDSPSGPGDSPAGQAGQESQLAAGQHTLEAGHHIPERPAR